MHLLNNVSSSVGATLTPAGLECSTGLITALYVKDPVDPQWRDDPGYKEWLGFMEKNLPDADMTDVNYAYGYNVSKLMHHVLDTCEDLSREGIMGCAANLKGVELPMIIAGHYRQHNLRTISTRSQSEQLARFDGKRWVTFGDVIHAGSH